MSMILQFVPWIAFALLADVDWRLALAVGVVAQIAVIFVKRPVRVGVLDAAMIVFFVVVGVYALLDPDASIKAYVDVISTAWLAVVAAGSLIVGHPFTLDFSRDTVSPEMAASPRFMAVNRAITGVWAAAFAGMALGGLISVVTDASWVDTAAAIVLLVVAIKFTIAYPQQVRAEAQAQASSAQAI